MAIRTVRITYVDGIRLDKGPALADPSFTTDQTS